MKTTKECVLNCPQCKTDFDIYSDGYQVNDINEMTFCSYECSYQHNLDNRDLLILKGYSDRDLKDLA